MAAAPASSTSSSTETAGAYFDGQSSRRRDVVARLADGLEICEDGAVLARWPYDDLRGIDGAAGHLRLRCASAPELARLELADAPFIAALEGRARKLKLGRETGRGLARIVLWSLLAAASILLTAIYGVPLIAAAATPLVPLGAERFLGLAVEKEVRALFGERDCHGRAGDAAMEKLVGALARQGGVALNGPPGVLKSRIANAFALPGGKVFVLSALIDKAENVDELAGVLAHELGHVAHRDGLRMLIQTGGTSFLFGLLFGDVTGSSVIIFAGRTLVDARYSRDAEYAADGFAIDAMQGLGRSAKPMGEFLLRVTGRQGDDVFAMFASHPLSQDRLDRMSKADRGSPGAPLLDDAEWRAIKEMCE